MLPVLIRFMDIEIYAWPVFYMLAAMTIFYLMLSFKKNFYPYVPTKSIKIFFSFSYIACYLGARVYSLTVEEKLSIFKINIFLEKTFSLGSLTFYGGAIGILIVTFLFSIYYRGIYREIFDMAILSGLVGIAIGRVGCFLNGDDYGKPFYIESYSWISMVVPRLNDNIPRFPVQLLASFNALSIFVLLFIFLKKSKTIIPGRIGCIGMILYAINRFFTEFLRGDYRGSIYFDLLSPAQLTSLILFVIALISLTVLLPSNNNLHLCGTTNDYSTDAANKEQKR